MGEFGGLTTLLAVFRRGIQAFAALLPGELVYLLRGDARLRGPRGGLVGARNLRVLALWFIAGFLVRGDGGRRALDRALDRIRTGVEVRLGGAHLLELFAPGNRCMHRIGDPGIIGNAGHSRPQ